jgi:electron transport complex protein RnfC
MSSYTNTLRGIHLNSLKNSAEHHTVELPLPSEVVIPLEEYMGVLCCPTVAVGDKVKVGQKIGDGIDYFSSPAFASISGEVTKIADIVFSDRTIQAVTILSDGQNEVHEGIAPPVINDRKSFIAAIRESGLVGLGGAGFPTYVKLDYKDIENVHTLIINAAECEPYITSDYRECIESTTDIIEGINLVLKYTGIPKAIIVTENNKPKAVSVLKKEIRRSQSNNISVMVLNEVYPKGAEKVAIFESTGIVVGAGKLPADCGVIVLNVSTVSFISKYIKTGMPLVKKRITVDGDIVSVPMNVIAPVGTSVEDISTFAGIDRERCNMVIMGGMMMGVCLPTYRTPIIKQTNAILFFEKVYDKDKSNCIRCSGCMMVCPMKLMPLMLEKAFDKNDAEELEKYDVNICINCGCCSYVCPTKRDLAHKIQLAKIFLKEHSDK